MAASTAAGFSVSVSSISTSTGIAATGTDPDQFNLVSGNPANENILLYLNSESSQKLNVNLYTIAGRLVANLYEGNLTGSTNINYSSSELPSGIYIIKAAGQQMDKTIKCVVQH
jgi:hypothetical protein